MQQKIIILDFCSQTTQLIGRRVRELDTFCEILPYNKFPKDDPTVIGVILSGSPYSVHDPEAFKVDLSQFVGRVPVLGICYGAQFISHTMGGRVEKADSREYGRAHLEMVDTSNPLFRGFDQHSQVWMSHGDTITAIPDGFKVIGSTKDVKNAAFWSPAGTQFSILNSQLSAPVFAVQFHPEVFHTVQGSLLLKNFVVDICGSRQEWSAASFVDTTVAELKEQASMLGLKAKMGWEYHDGHLYASLRQALTESCGEAGSQAAEAGLEDFGRMCGGEAAALVSANADQDFEALPPYAGLK